MTQDEYTRLFRTLDDLRDRLARIETRLNPPLTIWDPSTARSWVLGADPQPARLDGAP